MGCWQEQKNERIYNMKKYEFTGETKQIELLSGIVTLHRIHAEVCGDAKVFSANHVLVIGAIGSRNDFTTFFRDKDNEITVKCGCFHGKIDKFLEEVTATHGDSKYALVYRAAAEAAKLQILKE